MTAASSDLLSDTHLATVARVRTVCTAAGVAGAAASMAANMLASDGTAVGLAVGAIAPGAFILAADIASTASSLPRARGTGPLLATLVGLLVVIGTSAAAVSFGHLREVVAGVGESPVAEVLIAIVVDAVAVMGLVGHRLTGHHLHRHHAAAEAKRLADEHAATEAAAVAKRREAVAAERQARRAERDATPALSRGNTNEGGPVPGDDPSLPPADRARAVARANPDMTQADIGELIGRGERTVRRYLAGTDDEVQPDNVEAQADHPEKNETNDDGQQPGLVAV